MNVVRKAGPPPKERRSAGDFPLGSILEYSVDGATKLTRYYMRVSTGRPGVHLLNLQDGRVFEMPDVPLFYPVGSITLERS